MSHTFFTSKGIQLKPGKELGKGGEGSVYENPLQPNQVIKLYNDQHVPDGKKQAKLRSMAENSGGSLLSYAAWPIDTVHTSNGTVVGFIMPKVSNYEPVHMLYSPAHRRQSYPQAAWDFLLQTARNTAAAFATIHNHGHVIGDVNQGNVLVGKDSKIMLIDCDSFQTKVNSELHFCKVGVSHFTPPELQGLSSFDGIRRTANHDNFGLALLVFHLLFGGRHPYSGKPLRKDVGDSLESDIAAFRFAYAKDRSSRGFEPPPGSIPISIIPEATRDMFETAFTERGASSLRPSAQQWVAELDKLRTNLKRCTATPMHVYPNHQNTCLWCSLEDKGIVYFLNISINFASQKTGFVLAKVWAAIESIPGPPAVSIPAITSIPVTPTPLSKDAQQSSFNDYAKVCLILGGLSFFLNEPRMWLPIVLCVWLGWLFLGDGESTERQAERIRRSAEELEAKKAFDFLEGRIRSALGQNIFFQKKQELAELRNEYQKLPEKERAGIANLSTTAQARQKQRFLEGFFIDSATIHGVGLTKKSALKSFGIETAADVSLYRVQAVRGFGDVLSRAVVDWRKTCERKFVFNPAIAVTEADKNVVRAKVAKRKQAIETSLTTGITDLQRIRQESDIKTKGLHPQIAVAAKRLAQAKADMTVF